MAVIIMNIGYYGWVEMRKMAMVKMCSIRLFLNKYALLKQIVWSESSVPNVTSDPLRERQKLKIQILFLPWLKCIHSNLKRIIVMFKQESDKIYRPHGLLSPK